MTTNFDFLKKTDKNLYEIIAEAELLYRDEYFEQCMGQTRRFAENICKNVLGSKRTTEDTFDQMLATLKDNSKGSTQEKEFIEDLYFLKKCGNKSVHSSSVKKDGINALECLQRAFEVAISYTVYNKKGDKNNLNLHYDIQLLATGKRDKTLAQKYATAATNVKNATKKITKTSKTSTKTQKKQTTKSKLKTTSKKQAISMKSCQSTNKISSYWIFAAIISFISICTAMFLLFSK